MANHKKHYKHHSIQDLERNLIVAGKAPRTVQSYCRAIRMLGEYGNCDPAILKEEQVRDYLIYCRGVKKWKYYTLKVTLTAAKFFFNYCSDNKWQIWDFAKPPRFKPEILILTPSQIRSLIEHITVPHLKVCVALIASTGMRVGEAVRVKVADIRSSQKELLVRDGKGNKSRYVPIAPSTLQMLRTHWKTHRNEELLFPGGRGREIFKLQGTKKSMGIGAIQRIVRIAAQEAKLPKGTSPHTLRHSYATNMLDEGINVRVLSQYLGHETLETTMRYLHLTAKAQKEARIIINKMAY